MRRLLAIEWIKLVYNKTTRNFIFIYFLILIIIGIFVATFKHNIGGVNLNLVQLGTFNFPVVWQNIAYVLATAKIFLAVIVISNSTMEYENTTLKQNLIDGLTKTEFLQTKWIANGILALFSTLFALLISLVLGLLFSTSDAPFFYGMNYVTAYFIKLVLFFTLCTTLAIWLRKTSYAFLGLFAYWVFEGIMKMIDHLFVKGVFHLSDYLPLSVSNDLVPSPDFSFKDFIMGQSIFSISEVNWISWGLAVVYILLLMLVSKTLLKRRDL